MSTYRNRFSARIYGLFEMMTTLQARRQYLTWNWRHQIVQRWREPHFISGEMAKSNFAITSQINPYWVSRIVVMCSLTHIHSLHSLCCVIEHFFGLQSMVCVSFPRWYTHIHSGCSLCLCLFGCFSFLLQINFYALPMANAGKNLKCIMCLVDGVNEEGTDVLCAGTSTRTQAQRAWFPEGHRKYFMICSFAFIEDRESNVLTYPYLPYLVFTPPHNTRHTCPYHISHWFCSLLRWKHSALHARNNNIGNICEISTDDSIQQWKLETWGYAAMNASAILGIADMIAILQFINT